MPTSRDSHMKLQEGFQQNLELESSLVVVRTLSDTWCLLSANGVARPRPAA